MKTMKKDLRNTIILCLALFKGGTDAQAAEPYLPTNTNPALLYWREFAILPDFDSDQFQTLAEQTEIDAAFRRYTERFNDTFRRLGKTDRLTAPCNWGDDLDEGPELLLPYLSKARDVARVGRLRVKVHLADNNESAAIDDLLSIHRLSSHVGSSPILINALVHYAMDKIFAATIAENLGSFSQESLRRLKAGLLRTPEAKPLADSIDTERRFMVGWFRQRLTEILHEHGGDNAGAREATKNLFGYLFTIGEADDVWEAFEAANAKDVRGIIRLIDETNHEYDRLETVCRLPLAEAIQSSKAFDQESTASKNPIRREAFPAISKAVVRAAGNQVVRAMVLTAINYRLIGEAAFREAADPVSGAPFKVSEFKHDEAVVGFILASELEDDRDKRHLFLLKPTPNLQLSGSNIGDPN